MLNKDQMIAYNKVINHLRTNNAKPLLLSKSFVINCIRRAIAGICLSLIHI